MNEHQEQAIADILGIDTETKAVLDAGSDHVFSCRCEVCRRWWAAMGPEDGSYGPFTEQEVHADLENN